MGLCLWCLKEEAVAHFRLCHLGKALIVGTHHAHIDNLSAKTDTLEGAGDMEYVNALGTKKVAPIMKNER